MSTPRIKRAFSDDFKADAVRMVTEPGKSRAQAARDLGVNEVGSIVIRFRGNQTTGQVTGAANGLNTLMRSLGLLLCRGRVYATVVPVM